MQGGGMKVGEEIKNFLVERKFIKTANELNNEDSLLEKGVIDSVGMLELVSFIETEYSIKIDEDELMPENFDSLKAIQDFITRKTK
jgi:acyl carrier protein